MSQSCRPIDSSPREEHHARLLQVSQAEASTVNESCCGNIGGVGRRNHYSIDRRAKMRHPAQIDQEIGDLLDLLSSTDST
jgi:hypothetical protein